MRLIDEEEVEKQKIKTQKTKRMIIITIVLLLLLCSGIIALIAYRMANPTQITTYSKTTIYIVFTLHFQQTKMEKQKYMYQ